MCYGLMSAGTPKWHRWGQDVGQDDRFIIATIGDGELSRCAKPFRSVVEKLSALLARKLEIEVLQRTRPAHGETKLQGSRAAALGSMTILVLSGKTATG